MVKSFVYSWFPAGKIVGINRLPDGSFEVTQESVVSSEVTRFVLPKGEIVDIKRMRDASFKVRQEVERDFVFIEASNLSMANAFLSQFDPHTESEKNTKDLIEEAIRRGVEDFYCRICDPSFTEGEMGICFETRKIPAIGKSYRWNEKAAREYAPEYNSRLGTRLQYGAFLGVLLNELIDTGLYTITEAWNVVCNNSSSLSYHLKANCINFTGVSCACDFYDLATTNKILAPDEGEEGFWLASGSAFDYEPISHLCHCVEYGYDSALAFSTAWVVADIS